MQDTYGDISLQYLFGSHGIGLNYNVINYIFLCDIRAIAHRPNTGSGIIEIIVNKITSVLR